MIRSGVGLIIVAWIVFLPGVPALGAHEALVAKHAATHGVPEALIHRVIRIESRGNAKAVSKGNYGLMQIRIGTARAMGYRGGPDGLLDPDTNMTYAVKYLAGAYRAAGCNADRAVHYYQRGFHRVRRAKCSPLESPKTQVASRNTETIGSSQAGANPGPAQTAPQSTEVLKPKVVQTIAIAKDGLPQRKPQTTARAAPDVFPPRPSTARWPSTPAQSKPTPEPEPEAAKPEAAKPVVASLDPEPAWPPPLNGKPAPVSAQSVAKTEPLPPARQVDVKIEPEPVVAPPAIAKPSPEAAQAKAEPLPPVKQAVAKIEPEPAAATPARVKPSRSSARSKAKPEAESGPVLARLDPEPIVRDADRPDVQAASNIKPKAERRSKQKRTHSHKHAAGPPNLLSFLKKLVTPDQRSRRRQARH